MIQYHSGVEQPGEGKSSDLLGMAHLLIARRNVPIVGTLRTAHNPEVEGSNPSPAISLSSYFLRL